MGGYKAESLSWLDKLKGLQAQLQAKPDSNRDELKNALKTTSDTLVTGYLALNACFDPMAEEKVRQAAKSEPSFILSYNSARGLARLKGKMKDSPDLFHAALDKTLSCRLTTQQVKNLVVWVKEGHPVADFDPKKKPPKPIKRAKTAVEPPRRQDTKENKIVQPNPEEEPLIAPNQGLSDKETGTDNQDSDIPKKLAENSLFWEILAGVSPLSQVRVKFKRGESLSLGEKVLVMAHFIGEGSAWLFENLFKPFFRWFWDGLKKAIKESFQSLGKILGPLLRAVLRIVFWVIVALLAWHIYQQGFHPIAFIESNFHQEQPKPQMPTPLPSPQPTPVPAATTTSVNVSNPTSN
jgi:hypothetical protein